MPNSDDEDFSDGELSTQGEIIAEDDQEPENTQDVEDKNAPDVEHRDMVQPGEGEAEMGVVKMGRMQTATAPSQSINLQEVFNSMSPEF